MCCVLRAAALRLIGSLTLSDQLCGRVGVVLTGRVEGTDFQTYKKVFFGGEKLKRGLRGFVKTPTHPPTPQTPLGVV